MEFIRDKENKVRTQTEYVKTIEENNLRLNNNYYWRLLHACQVGDTSHIYWWLLLRLHLPRGDVRFICLRLTVRFFQWIEVGYGLRRVCLHFIRQSCDFFHWLSTDRRKAVE